MVRGAAALLGGTAYFLSVGELPAAGAYAAGVAGAVAVALCALAVLPGREEPAGLGLLALGALLLVAALATADVGAAANPVEALVAAAAGALFARAFPLPAAVLGVPLLVAGIDVAAVLGVPGPPPAAGRPVDPLTFDLPRWDAGGSVARLGILDAAFLAMFAAWAARFDLRPRTAIVLMVAGLAGAVALSLALERTVPALPFLAAGFLLPAAPRLARMLRAP